MKHKDRGLGRENGTTVAKRRLLEQVGWKVVNVSYKDTRKWDELLERKGGERERRMREDYKAFLKLKLAAVGVEL